MQCHIRASSKERIEGVIDWLYNESFIGDVLPDGDKPTVIKDAGNSYFEVLYLPDIPLLLSSVIQLLVDYREYLEDLLNDD